MSLSKYDEILLGVLKEKGNIIQFLDAVFGFLYKCTDFYRIQEDPSYKVGFPPGMAQNCVLKAFKKWEKQARQDDEYFSKTRMCSDGSIPPAVQETDVTTEVVEETEKSKSDKEDGTGAQDTAVSEKEAAPQEETSAAQDNASEKNSSKQQGVRNTGDSYNGAVRENYRWSQSILDLDVQVPVPEYITKARDVRVNITATNVNVAVKGNVAGEWKTLMEGELCWKTYKDESIWSLEPGRHVQVHLEKAQERWWDALLVSEPKIDLSCIDTTRHMADLAQCEQMKIQELIWNQERKCQGLPTSDQLAAENILKEAWNKEGSPFLGTEYDPSLINFGKSCLELPEGHTDPS